MGNHRRAGRELEERQGRGSDSSLRANWKWKLEADRKRDSVEVGTFYLYRFVPVIMSENDAFCVCQVRGRASVCEDHSTKKIWASEVEILQISTSR